MDASSTEFQSVAALRKLRTGYNNIGRNDPDLISRIQADIKKARKGKGTLSEEELSLEVGARVLEYIPALATLTLAARREIYIRIFRIGK